MTFLDRILDPIDAALNPPGPAWPSGFAGAYLGFGARDPVFSGPEHSTLVIGPPRGGKTTGLVIPALALWPGPAVVTSTKPDVLHVTAARRRQGGKVWCWDPDGTTPLPPEVEPLRWTPLAGCADWDTAIVRAAALVGAARPNPSGDQVHWTERAGALLATLLHAAALHAKPLEILVGWLQRRESWEPLDLLSTSSDSRVAHDLLTGINATDQREQSGIWSSADSVLAAYRTTRALAAANHPNFDPVAFARSTDTLYLVCPATAQAAYAPLVCALLDQLREQVAARRSFWPPMLWALDELANIAPLPNLPNVLAEAGGHGLLVRACLQDLSQARARWGNLADGFLTLFSTAVLLPG